MNRQISAIVVLLGIVAVIYVGFRIVNKQSKARAEERQKTAYDERIMAMEVACDECGTVSPMKVSYEQRRKFQVCPHCGVKRARPIVYYKCNNPECHQQLIKFINNVFEGSQFFQSPDGGVVCPNCRRADLVNPEEISINKARSIAKETGQDFPY